MTGPPATTPLLGPRACLGRGLGQLWLAGGPPADSGRPAGVVDELAEAAWRVFAPLVAARPVMRVVAGRMR
jgi:hypothetical protein